jgi:hypothetical protein
MKAIRMHRYGGAAMFGPRKLRLANCAAVPLAMTVACWSFTVPTTRSLIVPPTVTLDAVVDRPSAGVLMVAAWCRA